MHSRYHSLFSFVLPLVALAGTGRLMAAESYEKDIRPILENYCWDCHADGADKGGIVLDKDGTAQAIAANAKLWSGVQFHLEQWTMPPADEKVQPTREEREKIVAWLDGVLQPVDPAKPDPGRVTIRRLNRVEYNNTVRDLLGVTVRPADEFPEDDTGYGFDNIGDVLTLPPILMERYLVAADKVLVEAIPESPPPPEKNVIVGRDLVGVGFPSKDARLLAFSGVTYTSCLSPVAGEFIVRISTWQDAAGKDPAQLRIAAGGKEITTTAVTATNRDQPQIIECRIPVEKGETKLELEFTNDFYDGNVPEAAGRDRNLFIGTVEFDGPHKARGREPSAMARRIFGEAGKLGETEAGARAVLKSFANRAFRRAALDSEVERLVKIFKAVSADGGSWKDSLRIAMKAVLVSPWFLFRIEWQAEPGNPDAISDISELALASRLSYWLWSSTPDDELLSLAFRNQLRPVLRDQILRMLKDPRARALAENFAGQWLELRTLNGVQPDKDRFPQFNDEVRIAMRQETEEFFWNMVRENLPLTELLSADYSFLNEPLARYYGIDGVTGPELRKVKLDPSTRRTGGVLTHGSVLTLTSDTTRTAPVKRGKWVLENLLGVHSPPPPANVPPLTESKEGVVSGTLRQRLEIHRSKPGCVSCHALMDPPGFGLENFDAAGRWRDKDGGELIDSSGVLTTGQKFNNAGELAAVILNEKQDAYLHNVTEKMLIFALGRGLEAYDRPAVSGIMARLKKDGPNIQTLVLAVADSLPFQKRRGDPRK